MKKPANLSRKDNENFLKIVKDEERSKSIQSSLFSRILKLMTLIESDYDIFDFFNDGNEKSARLAFLRMLGILSGSRTYKDREKYFKKGIRYKEDLLLRIRNVIKSKGYSEDLKREELYVLFAINNDYRSIKNKTEFIKSLYPFTG